MARVRAAQLLVRAVCPLRLPAALAPLPLSRSLHSSAFTRWPRLQASIAAEEATQAQKSLSFHVPSANAYPPHGHTTFLHENEAENEEENVGLEVEIENPAGDDAMGSPRSGAAQGLQTVKLKVLHEGQHNLTDQSIPWHTWRVLRTLHDAGHEAYVVGGSVRDLFLGETPKDFDVLSTADPYQVKRLFQGRAIVVGRRFPICHVRTHGIITEVSSFSTESKDPFLKGKGRKKQQLKLKKQRFNGGNPAMNSSEYEWDDRDTARWRNSLKRDFTVNGLMYEPFKRILYDYVGGIQDLKFRKVRTILPADSLNEDPARYLRAIRIAARLGLSLDSNVSRMLDNSAPAVALVGKSRLMSEVHIMLAYGAAEASLRLLWRFRLLELLLPLQAEYLRSLSFARRSTKTNFLLELMGSLDRFTSPDKPCNGSLWVALLAFHMAVDEQKVVLSSTVITAAALAVHDGQGAVEAAKKAQRIHKRLQKERNGDAQDDRWRAANVAGEGIDTSTVTQVEPELVKDEHVEGRSRLRSKDAESTETSNAIAGRAIKLLKSSMEQIQKLTDFGLATTVTKERLGIEVGDLVVIAKTNAFRARSMFDRYRRRKKDGGDELLKKTRSSSHEREHEDAEDVIDDELKSTSYMFSRIVLNSIYPRTP